MRNRAKCLKCNSIIESVSRHDYVTCSCGEISIDGGPDEGYARMRATDYKNFVVVEDDGTEKPVYVKEQDAVDIPQKPLVIESAPTREELLEALTHLSRVYRDLPQGAKMQPVTHSDLHSMLDICLALFRSS